MKLAFLFVAAGFLAACGQKDPVTTNANSTAALPTIARPESSPDGGRPTNSAAPASAAAAPGSIPAALQGRWGLTPRDCTSGLGDAKGLLVVNSSELRFYESRAVPAAGVETTANSISGTFNFTGEGQSWSRYEALEANGSKMVRTERNPLASFSYARCS